MKTPLIIVMAATLVGCSRQPPHQAAAESCTDKHGFVSFDGTAADQPIELASFRTNPPTKETKFTIAAMTEKRPSHRAGDRAHLATMKAKPTILAAKGEAPATRMPLPRPSSMTQLDPKNSATPSSGATGLDIADSRPTVDPAPNSPGRTIQEQVAAATAVAERMTVASVPATRDDAGPMADASRNDLELLVAVVMVRPEIRSVSDLAGKNIAMDERDSAFSVGVRVGIIVTGGPVVQISAEHTTAIDRLVNGEVPAAVLAVVSADAAEGFPEIAGFRIFRIPLWPRSLKARP